MNLRLLLTSSVLGLSLVACNGGGSTPSPTNSTGVVTQSASIPTPTTSGSNSLFSLSSINSSVQTQSGVTSAALSLPTTLGNPTGTLTVAAGGPPSNVGTFSVAGPVSTDGSVSTESATLANATSVFYIGFSPTAVYSIPAASNLSFTFGLLNTPSSSVNYHLAFYNGSSWTSDTTDIGVVGTSAAGAPNVTVSVVTPAAVSLSVGTTYAIALYSIPTSLDTGAVSGTLTFPTIVAGTTSTSTVTAAPFGASATLTLPGATSGGTIPYTLSRTAFTGTTAPTSGVTTVFGYAKFTPSTALSFPASSTLSGTLSYPGVTPTGTFKAAYSFDGKTWISGNATSSISGSTVTMTATNSGTINLVAGTPFYVAIYQ